MNQQTALITGGGGLSSAIAEHLEKQGWRVAILSRRKPAGFSGDFYQCDLTVPQQVARAISEAAQKFGAVDAAIHTAVSPIVRKRALDISEKEFMSAFEVDVFGGFCFFKNIAHVMKQRHAGRLLAITTEAIELPNLPGGMAGYISAKFALRGLLKILQSELASSNISVSAIAPGFVKTPLNKDVLPRLVEFLQEQKAITTPEEVAKAACAVLTMPFEKCAGKTFFVSNPNSVPL